MRILFLGTTVILFLLERNTKGKNPILICSRTTKISPDTPQHIYLIYKKSDCFDICQCTVQALESEIKENLVSGSVYDIRAH